MRSVQFLLLLGSIVSILVPACQCLLSTNCMRTRVRECTATALHTLSTYLYYMQSALRHGQIMRHVHSQKSKALASMPPQPRGYRYQKGLTRSWSKENIGHPHSHTEPPFFLTLSSFHAAFLKQDCMLYELKPQGSGIVGICWSADPSRTIGLPSKRKNVLILNGTSC
ncbi:hypothetical protein P168DRAFT_286962 [Aspergillus campestris IBT 28561]|uniref:Uncharacterized protein n=1 Tax=Aspergillus campestris (strain IBT 28561) TaxID=1392248 RepID=A0A2I1DG92_ASPC2|nr:uncharacterized protein P168DRAFT_286962 [Aspergillus campestris IBT 28561]PKY08889.1 hypothetical protein P168DRAFT_286962 [Aspergillus campestris IBT 28561]